ncbi:MAG: MBL fold metallo-hydrolase [Myxococcales bacterium]|nr:MBL fold metallo-hydrolase [Myxococcales bacterium]
MEPPFAPADQLVVLPSHLPAPGLGLLPVQAFLLRGDAPVLIDAGLAVEQDAFLDALDCLIDLHDLRALVITHDDADHTGALAPLLDRAPHAVVVTSQPGAGKLSASHRVPPDRLRVATPGRRLDIGARAFRVLPAPLYDSPGTLMLLDEHAGWLFSSDAFGAFLPRTAEDSDELDPRAVLDGMSWFGRARAPWVAHEDAARWRDRIEATRAVDPSWLFASHLPPTRGALLEQLWARAAALPREGEVMITGADVRIEARPAGAAAVSRG